MLEKLKEIFRQRGDELAEALFQKAVDGDMKAIAMIRELAREDEQEAPERLPDELARMSDDELRLLRSRLTHGAGVSDTGTGGVSVDGVEGGDAPP